MSIGGSSPLTRGKHDARVPRVLLDGLIPAHAGKTTRASTSTPSTRAHPRSRGENGCRGDDTGDLEGSSPLTRGKRQDADRLPCPPGLIPAHAGKTARRRSAPMPPWAHPRSRGENATNLAKAAQVAGSSPLTRGKHRCSSSLWRTRGLIPAHAGKTGFQRPRLRRRGAHPRSCGENGMTTTSAMSSAGSSPLMRGKPWGLSFRWGWVGLIPAHAGKTRSSAIWALSWRAHPRSCGENTPPLTPPVKRLGSSPLMRGKHRNRPARHDRSRLIPAHAGKTP